MRIKEAMEIIEELIADWEQEELTNIALKELAAIKFLYESERRREIKKIK